MLPAAARVRRSEDFKAVLRRGRRAARGPIVVHLLSPSTSDATAAPTRAGFVVGRAVGNAVTRNAVRRRLRHLVRDRLAAVPPGSMIVVRALPGAADLSFHELSRALDRGLSRTAGSPIGGAA